MNSFLQILVVFRYALYWRAEHFEPCTENEEEDCTKFDDPSSVVHGATYIQIKCYKNDFSGKLSSFFLIVLGVTNRFPFPALWSAFPKSIHVWLYSQNIWAIQSDLRRTRGMHVCMEGSDPVWWNPHRIIAFFIFHGIAGFLKLNRRLASKRKPCEHVVQKNMKTITILHATHVNFYWTLFTLQV